MKKLITDYSFNSDSGIVQLTQYSGLVLENFLLVTNVTQNKIIYNFADPTAGGFITGTANDSLKLNYQTSGVMSNADALQIFIEDINKTPSTAENQIQLEQLTDALYELVNRLNFLPAVRGSAADIRASVVNTVNTNVGTATNLNGFGLHSAFTTIKDLDNSLVVSANINNIIP